MIYVGIDIAKLIHMAVVMGSNGEIPVQPFPFQNNAQGLALLQVKHAAFPRKHFSSVWNQPLITPRTSSFVI